MSTITLHMYYSGIQYRYRYTSLGYSTGTGTGILVWDKSTGTGTGILVWDTIQVQVQVY